MEKCEHMSTITHFCIYEHCSSREAGGCEICVKKYHSHVGSQCYIKSSQLQLLIQKFNVQSSVKPKCRALQQHLVNFFNVIKNQISQTIDITCNAMVNKVGYPFLSDLNNLSAYKRIKRKEYRKITSKQLRKFILQTQNLQKKKIEKIQKQMYANQIQKSFSLVQKFQKLIRQYQKLIKDLCKNFKHDFSAFKKLQQLKKYLDQVLKNEQNQKIINKNQNIEQKIKKSTSIKSNLISEYIETSPSQKYFLKFSIENQQNLQKNNVKQKLSQVDKKLTIKEADEKNKNHSVRNKYKHSRNHSFDRQSRQQKELGSQNIQINIVCDNFIGYQSKQRQINQRKQKLIKMMSFSEKKSTSITGKIQKITSPPLLEFQNNKSYEKTLESKKQSHNLTNSQTLSLNYLKIQSKKEPGVKNKKLISLSDKKKQILPNSSRSFQQSLGMELSDSKNDGQETKYKYAITHLPSSEQNSQQNINFVSISMRDRKDKKDRIKIKKNIIETQISHSANPNGQQSTEIKARSYEQTQQKETASACLYFMSLNAKLNETQLIKFLLTALKYDSKNISAAEYLSFIYLKQNKYKQCLDVCNEYLSLLSNYENNQIKVHFLNNKCTALNILGRYSQTITLLQPQILNLQNSKLYKNLADSYLSIGMNEKCQYNYEKAILLNQKFDEAMYNLAASLYLQGNYNNSNHWIDKALRISCKNQDYLLLKMQVSNKLQKLKQLNVDIP